jgi:beta-glucosidase
VPCTTLDRYEEDIANAAKLGSNSFRLSLEWSRLMPRKGEIDQEAKKG